MMYHVRLYFVERKVYAIGENPGATGEEKRCFYLCYQAGKLKEVPVDEGSLFADMEPLYTVAN